MKGFIFLGLLSAPFYLAQTTAQDSVKAQNIEAITFLRRLPVTKEIINVEKDLGRKNLGEDLPVLLKNQMSVISTSDAGNGIGYTGLRIRGVSARGINVMLNGVPYNDSESQGTFFVNVPDITSSASQIVIQRGVGTSSNGVSSFGASVNILSKDPEETFYLKTDDSYGSFNTYKYSAEAGTGKFWNNRLSAMGRFTHIHSDGYIDRAFSDLNSYHFAALFEENKTRLKLMTFGGKEKTYQAWNGVDKATWETNPTFNYSGAIYNSDWSEIVDFYDNETDNYRQNHYHLLWQQDLNPNWNLETTFHYTRGKGFYENYKQDAKFSKYNLADITVNGNPVKRTDFIRKKWLDNHFYGAVSTLYGKLNNWDVNLGLVANQYTGAHFGNVTGVYFPEIHEHEYYRNDALKTELAGFAKFIVNVNQWEFFGDLQLRNIDYSTEIIQAGDGEGIDLDKNWLFFNPKAGVNYRIPGGKLFLSAAVAQREPNRQDLKDNLNTVAEKLYDYEAGFEKNIGKVSLSANLFYMDYINQLVLSGKLDDIGVPIRENIGKTYRMGAEIGAAAAVLPWLNLTGNVTISENKIKKYTAERTIDNPANPGTQITVTENLGGQKLSFSPGVTANLLLDFQLAKNFSVGLQNQYVGTQYLDNSNREELKLQDYVLSDLSAQYLLPLRKTDVTLKLLVNNILNQKYVNNGFADGINPYYFAQAGTNFMFGLSLRFK